VLVAFFSDTPKLMTDYIKKYIKTIRSNSFHPLCETEIGRNAIEEFNFPPFIDASCSAVFFMHGIPSIFTGAVNNFGNQHLNTVGFAPIGLPLAWAIKLSHVACAILLILNR
jgi:hypothetical protein